MSERCRCSTGNPIDPPEESHPVLPSQRTDALPADTSTYNADAHAPEIHKTNITITETNKKKH